MGTPKPDQWRDGYKLAEKRGIVFKEYPRRNLAKILRGISDEALDAVKLMLRISAQKRGLAIDVLELQFFAGAQSDSPSNTPTSEQRTPRRPL